MENKSRRNQVNNGLLFHCNGCQRDITNETRIKCDECPDFDLCLECFSKGLEIAPHKNNHRYQIIRNMHFPLLSEDWGADEEFLLLESIEICGLDNWFEISDYMVTRSAKECKEHYEKWYLNSKTHPLPDLELSYARRNKQCAQIQLPIAKPSTNNAVEYEKEKEPNTGRANTKPPSMETYECNYNLFRREFEFEPFNNAELLVMNLRFDDKESIEEKERKLRLLEKYNKMYAERKRVREIARDNGLVDSKKLRSAERKRSKEENEEWNKYRAFLPCLGREEFEKFVHAMAGLFHS